MISLQYKIVEIPYKKEFTTAHGSKKSQKFLYVQLGVGALRGYGATPYIAYSDADSDKWMAMLTAKSGLIKNYAYNGPQRFWHFLHHLFPTEPYLVSALDIASWDLWGHWQRKPVRELIGYGTNSLPTDITVGMDTPQVLCQTLRTLDYEYVKLKWTDDNIDTLSEVANCANARLRLDLNEAWSETTTQKFLEHPIAERFQILEQPCAVDSSVNFRTLQNPHKVMVIADESFQTEKDLDRCAEQFHGINLKLPKCGGLTPAIDIIKNAQNKGLKILLGNMSEGVIGTSALAHLSSEADYLDLDGPFILEDDTASGLSYEGHIPKPSVASGLGIKVKW